MLSNGCDFDSLTFIISFSSEVSTSRSLLKGLVLLTSIASSSIISSSYKGNVLGNGGVSSKVTFRDSSTFIVCLFRIIYALLFCEYPRKTPS
jgi:ABC-type amino acid transport system permease subunit